MTSNRKLASSQVAWALLVGGVEEARLDVHRVRLMCDRVMGMVEGSEARDHLYQVAGDLIEGLPDRLSSAERALDRTSYALSVMGADFLKGRISLDDKELVEESLRTSPFSDTREKESAEARVAHRFRARRVASRHLLADEGGGPSGAPSEEGMFFHNPETKEVRQFGETEALSNKPSVAVKSVKDSDSPDRTVSEARSEAKKAPPDPAKIEKLPGGKQFSTLNRFLVKTEQPGVGRKVPQSREDIPKHPKIV